MQETLSTAERVFSPEQVEALRGKLDGSVVKERQGLSYLEGWYVIEELNRILGEGNWDGEVVKLDVIREEEVLASSGKTRYDVAYRCLYRLRVYGNGQTVVREDVGFGNGTNYQSFIGSHELALKEAVDF